VKVVGRPVVEMLPPPLPIFQLTALFVVPRTAAVNRLEPSGETVMLVGDTEGETGVALI